MVGWLVLLGVGVAGAQEPTRAVVHVETTRPGFTLGMVDARGMARANTGARISTVMQRDICVAPCSFEIRPGVVELYGRGNGKLVRTRRFSLNPGETHLSVQPGSSILYGAGSIFQYVGLTATVLGALAFATSSRPADRQMGGTFLAGGMVLAGGGLALTLTNRGRWQVVSTPPPSSIPIQL